MNNNFSFKKIYLSVSLFISFLIIVTFTILNRLTNKSDIIVLFSFFCLINIIIIVALLFYIHYKINILSTDVYNTIEKMIQNEDLPMDFIYNDTLFSQIKHKLFRLYEILCSSKNTIINEKTKLQELISDISHQIKTPLTTLKLTTSAMKTAILNNEELTSFIHSMDINLNKLDFLLTSLITTSRLETGVITLSPRCCNIGDTILTALENTMLSASKKNLQINYEYSNNFFAIHDPKWTAEALYNIIDNAIKYTDNNGCITIKLSSLTSYTCISITDTGIGIPESEIPNIFKRFYREQRVQSYPGVGIGLYLARDIIERQNGFIYVTSKVCVGSTFNVYLMNS